MAIYLPIMGAGNGALLVGRTPNQCAFSTLLVNHKSSIPRANTSGNGCELRSVDTEYLVTGNIPPSEREALDYPAPIVDHKQQQRRFKERYQRQKQGT